MMANRGHNWYWTQEEEDNLIELYNSGYKINTQIIHFLGRSINGINARLFKIRGEGRLISLNNDIARQSAKNLVNSGTPVKTVALMFKKTETWVRWALKEKDFKKRSPYFVWSEEEIKTIKENYSKYTLDELLKLFPFRSRGALVAKAHELRRAGLIFEDKRSNRPKKDNSVKVISRNLNELIEEIKRLKNNGLSVEDISLKLSISENIVKLHLGLNNRY